MKSFPAACAALVFTGAATAQTPGDLRAYRQEATAAMNQIEVLKSEFHAGVFDMLLVEIHNPTDVRFRGVMMSCSGKQGDETVASVDVTFLNVGPGETVSTEEATLLSGDRARRADRFECRIQGVI